LAPHTVVMLELEEADIVAEVGLKSLATVLT
jgi:hypothetical protein